MAESYGQIKGRLDEILRAVQDKDISLDDALMYYEEAVNLGLAASRALDDPADEQEAEGTGECEDASPAAEGHLGSRPEDFASVTRDSSSSVEV